MPEFTPEQRKIYEEMQRKENEGLTPEQIDAKNKAKQLKRENNIRLFNDTLSICRKGCYRINGKEVQFPLTGTELSEIIVFLPDEVHELTFNSEKIEPSECHFSCENKDAFSLASERLSEGKVLVLNLASGSRPGGGICDGANGQEEDLCRKSTLYLSLSSETAKAYYEYGNHLDSRLNTDSVMVSPHVLVIRGENEELLDTPYEVAVITCAAPMIRMGLEGKTEKEYEELLYNRVKGIITVAATQGYKNLILGAFGCGVFGNDARLVSSIFKKVFDELPLNPFTHVDFAVLCKDEKTDYNYQEFNKRFKEK